MGLFDDWKDDDGNFKSPAELAADQPLAPEPSLSQSLQAQGAPTQPQRQTSQAPASAGLYDDWKDESGNFKSPPRGVGGMARDLGVSLLKGAIELPEAVVGLADIPTGGAVGRALDQVGYRPKEAREVADQFYTPQTRRQQQELANQDGILDTVGYVARNPSLALNMAVESAPSVLGAGALARGAGLGALYRCHW